jgi:hypothetical protein
MQMFDIYATAGTFSDVKKLARDAAAVVKSVEQVPDIPMFRKNTALSFTRWRRPQSPTWTATPATSEQALTNAGALDRDKQIHGERHVHKT